MKQVDNKLVKKLVQLGVIIFMFWQFVCLQALAFDVPGQGDLLYVNDLAKVIEEDTTDYIMDRARRLKKETGAQIVVMTITNLNGVDMEEYAKAVFHEYKIGDAEKHKGILMLLATGNKEARIEVGYGLEETLNDTKIARIQDQYMYPYYRAEKWNDGILNGFNAIFKELEAEYNLDLEVDEPQEVSITGTTPEEDEYLWNKIGIVMLISCIFAAILEAISPTAMMLLLFWFIGVFCYFNFGYAEDGAIYGIIALVCGGLATILGWAITSPSDKKKKS